VRPSALSRLRWGAFEGPVFMRSLRSSIPQPFAVGVRV
jgi:hypothetical protein